MSLINKSNWALLHSLMISATWLSGYKFDNHFILLVTSLISFSIGLRLYRDELSSFPLSIGYPNLITLTRFLILSVFFMNVNSHLLSAILCTFLILDGVDGFVARKTQTSTQIGAYLDMETDALYVLLATMHLVIHFGYSPWIIGIGLLRYFYEILTWIFRVQNLQAPRTKWGPTAAVVLFICLLIPLVLNNKLAELLVYMGCGVVFTSFCISGWHQFRRVKT